MEGQTTANPLMATAATSPLALVLQSATFWLLASFVVGLLANLLPAPWLKSNAPAEPAVRPSPPPGIRRWKRWLPDAGPVLQGGVAKASLVSRDPSSLEALLVEIRRAELVHWALGAAGLLTLLWQPAAGAAMNLLFATCFNAPCLLLQRFNRKRVWHCLTRTQRP